jgi:hypothetical protein
VIDWHLMTGMSVNVMEKAMESKNQNAVLEIFSDFI